MSPKWMIGVAAVLFPVAGIAQAQVLEEKSTDDIACELAATCANFDSEAVAEPEEDADAPTRGWSLGSRARPAQASAAAPAAAARPRVRPVGMATSSSGARVGTRARVAAPKVPGRTTLGITFNRGSSALSGESLAQADKLYDALKTPALSKFHYMVAGHSDSVGNRELNLELSRRRAQSVVDYLVQKGLSRDKFRVRGYASERPFSGITTSSSVNRRVEVVKMD